MFTSRPWRQVVTGLAAGSVIAGLAACSSSGSSSVSTQGTSVAGTGQASGAGSSCKATGVTSNSITIGGIASLSGSFAAALSPIAAGMQARIDAQNADGGVNGRKINFDVADDQSTVSGNLAASQELVEGKNVAAIINGSTFTAGGGSYLKGVGLPVVGYGVTKEYETNPNFIPYTNTLDGANSTTATTTLWGQYLKSKGATTVYAVGSGDPQGAAAATALIDSSLTVGLKKGVLTTDLPPGTTNFTAEAQKAKAAGVNALALPLNPTSSLAVLQAMKQAGVPVKTSLLLAGYDPSVLKQAGSLLEGASFAIFFAPFEDKLPGQQTFEAALAKYTKASPGMFTMVGWLSADLMITGIQDAGSCPSGQNILAAINNIKGYTAGGLIPSTNYSPADRGKSPACAYFVTVHNGAFVPDNNGKPICATDPKLVPVT